MRWLIEIRSGLIAFRMKRMSILFWISFFLTISLKLSSQDTASFTYFGFHSGFNITEQRIDKCKTYYDSVSHVLFNPCYDFSNRGIYSSYLARRVFLGDCLACDTLVAVPLSRKMADIDWEDVKHHQQEAWDYYLKLWQKQDKLEKYYIDLEGTIRGMKPGPF
jgi:hypothetical protein